MPPAEPEEAGLPARALPESDHSDESLLRWFRRGIGQAATVLYFRYAEHLQSLAAARLSPDLAWRIDPEDIVQSVFRTFFRRAALGQFEVPEGEDLWKLFLVLALNKIRNAGTFHRAARRDVGRTVATEVEAGDGGQENALTVLQLVIDEVLQRLPASARQIVELRIEGYEVAEIAARAERSLRSVERVLRDFRDQLHRSLHPGETDS